jgi:hypothetical protein
MVKALTPPASADNRSAAESITISSIDTQEANERTDAVASVIKKYLFTGKDFNQNQEK